MKIDPMKVLPLAQLQLNEGQLPWLRKNPRSWTQIDIDRTKRSMEEDAELMQARPLLAVPGPDKDTFVVFGGNLRLTACRALGWPGAPVVVFRPDKSEIDRQTIHRLALKDNGSFGSWDTDELANWDFDQMELVDFGLPDFTGDAAAESPAPSAVSEDDFDEDSDEIHVRCKPGDIWELGEHRLMCGDSIDLEQVKTLMGGVQ